MDLIAAGTVTTGNTATIDSRSGKWYVMATTAAAVTIQFGANGPTISIPSINSSFIEVEGDYQSITVTGATVTYYVMG